MSRTLPEAALHYAARGWALFPCHEPGDGGCSCRRPDCASPTKHPRTPRGLHDATTDPATIDRRWRRWPTANIAGTGSGAGNGGPGSAGASSERSCRWTIWWAGSSATRSARGGGDAGRLRLRQRLLVGRARPAEQGPALHRSGQGPALLRWPGRGRRSDRSEVGGRDRHRPHRPQRHGRRSRLESPMDGRSLLCEGRRREVLIEYSRDPAFSYPTWASLRARRFQYVEYYEDDGTGGLPRVLRPPRRPLAAPQPAGRRGSRQRRPCGPAVRRAGSSPEVRQQPRGGCLSLTFSPLPARLSFLGRLEQPVDREPRAAHEAGLVAAS